MKSQKVEALDEVERDVRSAMAFYDSWRSDGGRYFEEQFYETLSWIEWNPELFPKRYKIFRRAIIRNTYFGVFYAIEPEVTTVVAVLDLRQRPSTIRRIVKTRRR
jgi:hypothetical protein